MYNIHSQLQERNSKLSIYDCEPLKSRHTVTANLMSSLQRKLTHTTFSPLDVYEYLLAAYRWGIRYSEDSVMLDETLPTGNGYLHPREINRIRTIVNPLLERCETIHATIDLLQQHRNDMVGHSPVVTFEEVELYTKLAKLHIFKNKKDEALFPIPWITKYAKEHLTFKVYQDYLSLFSRFDQAFKVHSETLRRLEDKTCIVTMNTQYLDDFMQSVCLNYLMLIVTLITELIMNDNNAYLYPNSDIKNLLDNPYIYLKCMRYYFS